ncbi:MAG: cysteine desulfurase DndA [Alicyclobacillus macrosporangiidus]|uniref:cysteine desulfurase DndA n=1 Tax=Alicyclobacillus macrosporangiidus TaxID=392015 RepID=UPI0026EAC225|nr:cysteine desulfurase DndA [Alicyclobacillus macrosporangiidus]MCL6597502.1 cysteine desulfurase DndA [Alicyclobacillus macrosporangiidus]
MAVYLDFNASTPVLPNVLDAMIDVYRNHFGNASSRTHIYGQDAKRLVDDARRKIAEVLGVNYTDIIFTSGATESNNLAIQGMAAYGRETGKTHIVTSVIEHSSVLEPIRMLQSQGFEVDYVPVDKSGRIDPSTLLSRVRKDTMLVSVMHANNETGIIQPVEEIGEALSDMGVFFHVDASQSFGKLIQSLRKTQYDLLSCTAHKVYGPQGIGALVTRQKRYRRPPLKPILYGGGHERGLRPGTLPVALIVGFGVAAETCLREHENWTEQFRAVRNQILKQLERVHYAVNGDQRYCLDNCINVSFPGVDSEALMMAVRDSLALSNGSACTSSEYRPSHVLEAMGCLAECAIRISWGPQISTVNLEPLLSFVAQVAG